MLKWLDYFRTTHLKYPEMVVLVPSNLLNPEPCLYYQNEEMDRFVEKNKKEEEDTKQNLFKKEKPKCEVKSYEEVNKSLEKLEITDPNAFEML